MPYCILFSQFKTKFEKHVDLLLLSNSKNFDYDFINDFDRFIANKIEHDGKKHFSRYCYQCFSSSKVSKCHTKNYFN